MFLGKQNGKIVLAKNTREEIENAPCMTFDEIVETPDEYVLWGNEYILKAEAEQAQVQQENAVQRAALQAQLDGLDLKAIRALRALSAGVGTEADKSKLEELETQAAQIRAAMEALPV